MKQLSILFLGAILLSSCEKETYVDYFIDNQSSSVITVDGSNIIHSTDIDQTINPNEKKDVANWSKRGKQTDYFEPTSMFGDDLVITNTAGDTFIKDYRLLFNWTSAVNNQRASPTHDSVVVITDADF